MDASTIELLGLSVTVALSPFPVLAIVPILSSPRGGVRGTVFALGWIAGLAAAIAVGLAVAALAGEVDDDAGSATVVGALKLVAGLGLVWFAVGSIRSRPRRGEPSGDPPGWIASLASAAAVRVTAAGFALAALNPKVLVLALGAAAAIEGAGLGTGAGAASFVAIGASVTLAVLAAGTIGGAGGRRLVAWADRTLARHGGVILGVLLGVIGVTLVVDGIAALT